MKSGSESERVMTDLPKRLLWLAGLLGAMGVLSLALLRIEPVPLKASGSGEVLLGQHFEGR